MRDFSKINHGLWIGHTGRSLRGDPESQVVVTYLLTAPGSSMIGLYYCPITTIANDTGLSLEGALKGLRRGIEGGFCLYDESTEWVWVCEMARFQFEASMAPKDKRVIGIARAFEKLPESPLKQGFYDRYWAAFHLPKWAPSTPMTLRPFEGPWKPHRSIEKEMETEQEKEQVLFQGQGLTGGTTREDEGRGRFAVVASSARLAGEGAR